MAKNPQLGLAKSRIAKAVGDQKALEIYIELLRITRELLDQLNCKKYLYYSEFIDDQDQWRRVKKRLQKGSDLGERMKHAFNEVCSASNLTLVIGSDCPFLTTEIIDEAFEALEHNNMVIGPSIDGGYYLLGMSNYYPNLLEGIPWSSDTVFIDTINIAEKNTYSYHVLPTLSDIDYYEDWLDFAN